MGIEIVALHPHLERVFDAHLVLDFAFPLLELLHLGVKTVRKLDTFFPTAQPPVSHHFELECHGVEHLSIHAILDGLAQLLNDLCICFRLSKQLCKYGHTDGDSAIQTSDKGKYLQNIICISLDKVASLCEL
jgi:hypothetical protein